MACLNEDGKKPEAKALFTIERIGVASVLEISLRRDVGIMSSWEDDDFILEIVGLLMMSAAVVGSN